MKHFILRKHAPDAHHPLRENHTDSAAQASAHGNWSPLFAVPLCQKANSKAWPCFIQCCPKTQSELVARRALRSVSHCLAAWATTGVL